ncbi:hypothetical protein ACYZT4_17555 [Pseudomonas sp. GB2N2]
MLMDDNHLKPYIEAVKKTRLVLKAKSMKATPGPEGNEDVLRAAEAYERAHKALAGITGCWTEIEE